MSESKNPQETEKKEETGILSSLVNALKNELGPALEEIEVKDVRIGLAYTGVVLSGGSSGVACTPLSDFSCCPSQGFSGTLKGSPASLLLELALSKDPLEAAVGVATANALSQLVLAQKPENCPSQAHDRNLYALILPGDRVAMVGYFKPLVPKILEKARELCVLEKQKIENPLVKVLSSERASEVLPHSDVVILTASTLVNGTLDELLSLCGNAREVVLLGPSAPLFPGPFFERGVTALMGTKITDSEKMLTVISEAGGTKKLHRVCGEKVAFRKKE